MRRLQFQDIKADAVTVGESVVTAGSCCELQWTLRQPCPAGPVMPQRLRNIWAFIVY